MPVPFLTWLRTQERRPDRIGDLARDLCADKELPATVRTARDFARYLHTCGACQDALDTYTEARAAYTAAQASAREQY